LDETDEPTGSDVVVIGGGIVGTSAAAFLAEAGARVTLIEREGLASAASGANSGVVQHPFDPILAALYRETLGLYRELSAAGLGFSISEEPGGLLYVSADESAVRYVDRSLADAFPELERDVVSGADLQRLEPAVAPGLWACLVGIGYPVQPGASTYAYATLAERRGVQIRLGRAATLEVRGDRIVGVVMDGRPLAADAVLVAAGPWTPELIDPSGRWRPIRHRWGVVVEAELANGPTHVLEEAEIGAAIGTSAVARPPVGATTEPAAAATAHADRTSIEDLVDFSLVPLGGIAAVGSTFLAAQPDPATWVERILTRAAAFVPRVGDAPIRGHRACARPQSADGRPLIGPVPGRSGLFVCAGHGAWGISTGPASARLVVDEILGRSPQIPPELGAARFGAP
jgi:D-amino-acid dehydrogenase